MLDLCVIFLLVLWVSTCLRCDTLDYVEPCLPLRECERRNANPSSLNPQLRRMTRTIDRLMKSSNLLQQTLPGLSECECQKNLSTLKPTAREETDACTHRLHSSSFLVLHYRILKMNTKKELLWSLWVCSILQAIRPFMNAWSELPLSP